VLQKYALEAKYIQQYMRLHMDDSKRTSATSHGVINEVTAGIKINGRKNV
jgi:hypothetical protein